MPAKKVISKEYILNAAFEIVRESGIDSLNMRSLAKRCNCSTQPIYLSFKSAEELKKQTALKVLEVFNGFIEREIKSGKYPEYKAVGMGYIRFAKEEKQLFKFLLMNDGMAKSGMGQNSFDESVMLIMKNYGLYQDDAAKLHLQMWIFVHGIASMFATEYIDFDWETVSAMLTDAYKGFTSAYQGDKK